MVFNTYHYILFNYTLTLLHQYDEHHLLFIIISVLFTLLMQVVNGAQLLSITFLLEALFACSRAAVIDILPL